MPARNQRGPNNEGPMTGRGMGPCNPAYQESADFAPRGRGFFNRFPFGGYGGGRGFHRRSRFFQRGFFAGGEDVDTLKAQANALEAQLNRIKDTIKDLEEK
ncbi:MAG: DUF5320 domain-containing protein [Anaerolineaceae bacterium]|nr:DUF5320 domain-containing protein [Anaerolineaceae bacterium]